MADTTRTPTTDNPPNDTPPAVEDRGGAASSVRSQRRRAGTITVKSPNPAFTGVKAGVSFNNGEAKVEKDTGAYRYFVEAGYDVSGEDTVERYDLPTDTNALAWDTFPGNPEEDKGRHDVAVPPPSAGIKEWQTFARGYNLRDVERSKDKNEIIERARSLNLID